MDDQKISQTEESPTEKQDQKSADQTPEEVKPEKELPTAQKPQELESPKDQATSGSPDQQADKSASPDKPTDGADTKSKEPTPPASGPTAQPPTKDVKGARWYVVHTYSGHEAKVATTLKQKVDSLRLSDKILDILVPTQEKIEIKEGKKSTVKEKIFPGYLLIRMLLDDDTWLAVRTTPGITSFVGIANKPTPIADEEVATIQKFMQMEAPKFKTTFSIGEAVKITDGPFSEFLGSISEIDEEKGKIKVLVSIFGRETPVELDFLQVAKL